MPKLNKSQTVYVAMRERGYSHWEALDLVAAGPMARSRYRTWFTFTLWAKEWAEGNGYTV